MLVKEFKLYDAFEKYPTLQKERKYEIYKNELANILRNNEKTYYLDNLHRVKAGSKET